MYIVCKHDYISPTYGIENQILSVTRGIDFGFQGFGSYYGHFKVCHLKPGNIRQYVSKTEPCSLSDVFPSKGRFQTTPPSGKRCKDWAG